MRCSKCDGDNREGRKFCAACGTPLVVICHQCGAANRPEERFCGDCGTALLTKSAAAPSLTPSWSTPNTAIMLEQTGASAIAKIREALFATLRLWTSRGGRRFYATSNTAGGSPRTSPLHRARDRHSQLP